MLSTALRTVTVAMIIIAATSAFIGSGVSSGQEAYPATVKVVSGLVAIVGSLYLAGAIRMTLLRSGGTQAFQAAYVSAAALCGPGLAEVLSVLWPAEVGHAMVAYCTITAASGILWLRFYGRSA